MLQDIFHEHSFLTIGFSLIRVIYFLFLLEFCEKTPENSRLDFRMLLNYLIVTFKAFLLFENDLNVIFKAF